MRFGATVAISRAGAATGRTAGGKARRRATEPPPLQTHRYTIQGGDGGLTPDNPLGRCIATVEYPRVVTVHWADELTGPTVARWDDWPWTERLLTIYGLLMQPRYLPAIRLDAIGFEVPWANRDIQGTMKPDAVIDLYTPLAHACNICIIDIQPAQARQALAGKGNATKDEMVAAARAYKLPAAFRKQFPHGLTGYAAAAPRVNLATARTRLADPATGS